MQLAVDSPKIYQRCITACYYRVLIMTQDHLSRQLQGTQQLYMTVYICVVPRANVQL